MFFFRKQTSQPHPKHHTFILEPILTPSGLVDSPGDDTPDLDLVGDSDIPDLDDTPPETDIIDPFLDDLQDIPFFTDEPLKPQFESGYFTVGDSGKVGIDFLYDGGGYKGQLAIFSLEGMEDLDPNSEEFIREAAQRASSNSTDGYIIIDDATEGAKFSGKTAWEGNFNAGEYKRVKDFDMNPGDTFGIMLVPNGTVEQVAQNPSIEGSIRPLFSLSTANPSDAFHVGQIADVTGDGNTFVMEDLRIDGWTDKDYNDIIFQVRGATGEAVDLDTVINSDRDWRSSDMGQALIEYAKGYVEEGNTTVIDVDAPSDQQPLIGIIDTGFSNENPDIDYDNITVGSDLIDGDDDPFVNTGADSKHGTHVLGIIGATQDNDMGIDGINDDAPIWIGRAVGSGKWAESLVEFVDAARESGQPNAVVNLSMDLTQIDAEGNVSTRYEFTPLEMAALEYARHNDVLVAVAAGNDGAVMSALGQASEQFDNIITVGAADGLERAAYSSYGEGLDIMAQGGTPDNPVISTVGDDVDGMYGTSVATAQVTGAISQLWAANPELSYQQVIEILKQTATDIHETGVDAETGAGLLNMAAAVHLAKTIQKEEYEKELQPPNLSWSGEGIYKPMERAANGSSTGSGSGLSSLSWGSFLGRFGNPKSASFSSFLKRIFNQFFNPLTVPDPDNNGTINQAKSIQANDIVTDFVGTSDRNDVYTFDLNKPQYVEILLDGLKANANIELIQDGKVLFKSNKTGTNADSITQFLKPGKYYVKVSSNINNGTTPYNLKVRSWSSVQPDNGSQPINGKQPVTGKIDSVYFSDVTGDSLADALVVNNWGTTTRRSTDSLFLENETWTENAYFGSRRTFFADVNGDGKADAIAVNNQVSPGFDGVYVKLSNGSEFGETKKWTDIGYEGEFGTFFADVTGDGKADAIVVNNGAVTVRRSDGTKFLPNETWTDIGYFGERGTFFADVTGDGKADAVVVNNGAVTVRRSDGTKFLPNETWTDIGY
ncbi:MAG: S8 family serine peptidase, partial [Jaaginema sp. PMC 1080.18]|nr:S8 family serine peptidase [Jaaginema sp. PMC 1080.18]MEC4867362.1 S8 family serine peptidase [Jaaginema sp. PMC 1078.18]